jgi:hypothetical protein
MPKMWVAQRLVDFIMSPNAVIIQARCAYCFFIVCIRRNSNAVASPVKHLANLDKRLDIA